MTYETEEESHSKLLRMLGTIDQTPAHLGEVFFEGTTNSKVRAELERRGFHVSDSDSSVVRPLTRPLDSELNCHQCQQWTRVTWK